jgi:hypothetical protein
VTGPITIRGRTYPGPDEAAAAFNISRKALLNAARKGRLDFVGIPAHQTRKRHGVEPTSVRIRGKVYASVKAAARRFKVSEATIRGAINRGREDFVGLGRSRKHSTARVGKVPHNGKPVVIGPHRWQSITRAARDLGVGATCLREKIKAGETAWLLCRAMQWQARQERHRIEPSRASRQMAAAFTAGGMAAAA